MGRRSIAKPTIYEYKLCTRLSLHFTYPASLMSFVFIVYFTLRGIHKKNSNNLAEWR